jgi:hypothetical protein
MLTIICSIVNARKIRELGDRVFFKYDRLQPPERLKKIRGFRGSAWNLF